MTKWTQAEEYLAKKDRALARVIKAVGPCTLKAQPKRSPYEALCRAVAHQQVHGKAAAAILARLVALFPDQSFPTPVQLTGLPADKLRACGFSASKVAALQDIAQKTLEGVIPDRRHCARLSDEELITRLTAARGVGRWTVEMFLMSTLGRADILPVDDFGIREGYRLLHKQDEQLKPKALALLGQRWAPYRTIASWYLWRAADLYRA
jgi:DNA-3-methyladenine glycosylase II